MVKRSHRVAESSVVSANDTTISAIGAAPWRSGTPGGRRNELVPRMNASIFAVSPCTDDQPG